MSKLSKRKVALVNSAMSVRTAGSRAVRKDGSAAGGGCG